MERIPRVIDTREFREQAVCLHEMDGMTIPEIAKRLSLPGVTLKNGVYAARRGMLGEVGKNKKPPTELEMELARVKRELTEHGIRADVDRIKRIRNKLGLALQAETKIQSNHRFKAQSTGGPKSAGVKLHRGGTKPGGVSFGLHNLSHHRGSYSPV